MIRTKLRPDQAEAVEKAKPFDGFALYLDPRCGKTLIALSMVDIRRPERVLVVCPAVAVSEWEKQIPEHADFDFEPEIRIMTYQAASNRKTRKQLNRWLEKGKSMTILDEGHRIKARTKLFSRACRGFGHRSNWRLLLTGTPIGQGRHDGYAQMDFVDRSIFGDWEDFRDRYLVMGGYFNKKVIGYRNEDEFDEKFRSRSYRVTFNESLKKSGSHKRVMIRRSKKYGTMGPTARSLSDELEEKLQIEVNGKKIRTAAVIKLSMKLQQITGGFVLDDDGEVHRVDHTKEHLLQAWIRQEHDGTPFVIVCRFKHEMDYLEAVLTRQGLAVEMVRGGRKLSGKAFDVVILQIQSGLAIDLSEANTVIFYSWDYSYINFQQARYRVLSHAQTQVRYVFLMVRGSIDELLYQTVTRKKKLAETVCDHFRRRYDDQR